MIWRARFILARLRTWHVRLWRRLRGLCPMCGAPAASPSSVGLPSDLRFVAGRLCRPCWKQWKFSMTYGMSTRRFVAMMTTPRRRPE